MVVPRMSSVVRDPERRLREDLHEEAMAVECVFVLMARLQRSVVRAWRCDGNRDRTNV